MVLGKIAEGLKDVVCASRDTDFGLSSDYLSSSMVTGIGNYMENPSLRELESELQDDFGITLRDVSELNYD